MIITIPDSLVSSVINRLTNQLWKLIPMRENNENWETQLETLIVEIAGLGSLTQDIEGQFITLISKMKGLRDEETTFQLYRKTVFECISLLREMRL